MAKVPTIPDNIINLIRACHSHAKDLLKAAKKILEDDQPNIAYHLAVLALEEIGKSSWVLMHYLASTSDGVEVNFERNFDNHVKKIFLALWGPSLGKEFIDKAQLEKHQGLARKIHEYRLKGLYVSTTPDNLVDPKTIIESGQVDSLLLLVEARLNLVTVPSNKIFTEEEIKDYAHYLKVSEDPELKLHMMSKYSMNKLAELGVSGWMNWLREEFEKGVEEGRKITIQELSRSKPDKADRLKEKWKIKIRLFSDSHTIRRKALRIWNDYCHWIVLESVNNKKNELLVEMKLGLGVPLNGLWDISLEIFTDLLIALNVGTLGLFWWYLPEHITHFHETIIDLENPDLQIKMERSPALKIDWGAKALSEEDMHRVTLCFASLSLLKKGKFEKTFQHYVMGLRFFGKNDIHIRVEPNIYEQFYLALKEGMKTFGEWDGKKESYKNVFREFAKNFFTEPSEWEQYFSLGEALDPFNPQVLPITLKEAGYMKTICDAYFLKMFQAIAKDRVKKQNIKTITKTPDNRD